MEFLTGRIHFLAVIIMCYALTSANAQRFNPAGSADSVLQLIHANADSAKTLIHTAISSGKQTEAKPADFAVLHFLSGKYYQATAQFDSAKTAFRLAIDYANRANHQEKKHQYITELAYSFNQNNQYDSAIIYYEKSKNVYSASNDSAQLGVVLSGLGSAYFGDGQEEKALQTFYKAESYLKEAKPTDEKRKYSLGAVYENIAMLNINLGYENKSIAYYNKALPCYQQLADKTHLAMAYTNLGVSFKNTESLDSALYYYDHAIDLGKRLNDAGLLARNFLNKGNVLDRLGNQQAALDNYHKSLEICREHHIVEGIIFNKINIAEINLSEGKYKVAIPYLKKALNLGKQHGCQEMGAIYENLYTAYKHLDSMDKALFFLEKKVALRDSVSQGQKHQELMDLQTKYETQQKEAEILELKNRQQQERLLRARIIIVSGTLIALALIFILWSRKRRAKALQKAAILEKENQKRADELEKTELDKRLKQKEAERYRLDLELKEQELVFQTLKQASIAKLNQSVKERLAPYTARITRKKDQEDFQATLHEITHEVTRDPLSDFEQMFAQMHDGFYEKLLEKAPDMSNSELQMCALLRMNLPSKEIATLLNLAISTIDQRRHSIRKKLNLDNQQNLISVLIAI